MQMKNTKLLFYRNFQLLMKSKLFLAFILLALVSRKPSKMGLCIMTDRKAVGKGVKIRYFCVITFMAD